MFNPKEDNKRINSIILFIGFIFVLFIIKSCVTNEAAFSLCSRLCWLKGREIKSSQVESSWGIINCTCGGKLDNVPVGRP